MYAHNLRSSAPNCIIPFLCVRYYWNKICKEETKDNRKGFFPLRLCMLLKEKYGDKILLK